MHGTILNLLLAWLLILLGFLSGLALGTGFHRENWLGGYGSLRRRLYRLGHISLFALGVVNLLFYLTVGTHPETTASLSIASRGFLVGAVTMPLCCLAMAHFPKLRLLFAIPVLSLVTASLATFLFIVHNTLP